MPIYTVQGKIKRTGIMGLNVSSYAIGTNLQFENKDVLKNTARDILSKSGATSQATHEIIEKTIFEGDRQLKELYTNPQLAIIKASTQISVNSSLKETLKYLKEHANKKEVKKPVLGELWNAFSASNENCEDEQHKADLYEFNIDFGAKNIFAA